MSEGAQEIVPIVYVGQQAQKREIVVLKPSEQPRPIKDEAEQGGDRPIRCRSECSCVQFATLSQNYVGSEGQANQSGRRPTVYLQPRSFEPPAQGHADPRRRAPFDPHEPPPRFLSCLVLRGRER